MKRDHFWHDVGRVRCLLRCKEPCDSSELAGFFDGDGCFYNAQKQIGCNITQCHYPTLRRIQGCFGGTIWKRDTRDRSEKQRFQYGLSFRNIEVAAIVPIVKDHLVLKELRAHRLLRALDLYNKTDEASASRRLELVEDETDEYKFDRINKSYIRGLFCAEGCVSRSCFSLCQKSNLEVLHRIKSFVEADLGLENLGKVTEKDWVMHKKHDIKIVLDWMTLDRPRLFHEEKAAQIDAFYAFFRATRSAEKNLHADRMTALKHEDHDVPETELAVTNATALEFTAKLRSVVAGHAIETNKPKSVPLTDEQRKLSRELLRDTDESFEVIAARARCTKAQVAYLKKNESIGRPNPVVKNSQLTPEQRRIVEDLLPDPTISLAAIAIRAGCNKGQVFFHGISIGDTTVRRPGRKRKCDIEVVAPRVPRPPDAPTRRMAPRLTVEQKTLLLQLAATTALTLDAIAERVGCTKAQVCTFKKKFYETVSSPRGPHAFLPVRSATGDAQTSPPSRRSRRRESPCRPTVASPGTRR